MSLVTGIGAARGKHGRGWYRRDQRLRKCSEWWWQKNGGDLILHCWNQRLGMTKKVTRTVRCWNRGSQLFSTLTPEKVFLMHHGKWRRCLFKLWFRSRRLADKPNTSPSLTWLVTKRYFLSSLGLNLSFLSWTQVWFWLKKHNSRELLSLSM